MYTARSIQGIFNMIPIHFHTRHEYINTVTECINAMDNNVELTMRNQINRSANPNQKHNKSHRERCLHRFAARLFKILTN